MSASPPIKKQKTTTKTTAKKSTVKKSILEPIIMNDKDTPIGQIESESYIGDTCSYLYIGTFKFDYKYQSSGDIPKKKTAKRYYPSITIFDAIKTTEYDEQLKNIPLNTTLKQYTGTPSFKLPNKITLSIIERYLNYIEVKLDKDNKLESGFQNDSIEFRYGQTYIVRAYILHDSEKDKYAFYQFHIYELLPNKSPPENLYSLYNLRRLLKPDWNNYFTNKTSDITPIGLVMSNEEIRNEIGTWYINGEPFIKPIPASSNTSFYNIYPPSMKSLIINTYYSKNNQTKKKIDPIIPQMRNTQCYDPINIEIREISEWINENDDNIILHINQNVRIATKRKIILPINIEDNLTYRYNILYPCKNLDDLRKNISRGIFNIQDNYISLKYAGIPGDYIINSNLLSNILNNTTRQFVLHPTNENKILITEIELMNSLDAYPELYSKIYDKDENNPGLYALHGDDMAAAVHGYTYRWDALINDYLRRELINKNKFTPDILNAVQRRIHNLDIAFANAPRFQKETTLYRAIKQNDYQPTIDPKRIKTGIFPAFISTTYSEKYAYKFLNEIRSNSNKQIHCCVYTYVVDAGVPYIPIAFSEGAGEQMEVLLPRDLELSIISTKKTNKAGFSEPVIQVSLPNNHSLSLKQNICSEYQITTIEELNDNITGGCSFRRKTMSINKNINKIKTRKNYLKL